MEDSGPGSHWHRALVPDENSEESYLQDGEVLRLGLGSAFCKMPLSIFLHGYWVCPLGCPSWSVSILVTLAVGVCMSPQGH